MFTSMTYEEGLRIAKKYNLESEYNACIADGMSPKQVLYEWDLF